MNADTWQKVKPLIADALDRPPGERDAFIDARCPDPALRAEVRAYLESVNDAQTRPLEMPTDLEDDDPHPLLPGSRIGPYVVVETIGRGGMGRVFLGEDTRLRRKVALKSLLGSKPGTAGERARIVHEARAAAQINHPNVATVYDVIEHDARAYIVMEYVEGETLAALLRRQRLPVDRVVTIGSALAAALAAAHAKGVVHRDLKPANVQITKDGIVKVLDFGVAAATAVHTTASTGGDEHTGGVQPGTRGYMSPEQMLNRHVDERSDVFCLGIVLFEMATGERAYLSTDAIDLMAAVNRPVRRADEVDRRVPVALADVIQKALEVDLVKRFHTAADLQAALDALRTTAGPLPKPRAAWAFYARTALGILTIGAGVALVQGFITTRTYNVAMGRRDFQHETWLNWLQSGLKMSVPPLAVLATGMVALSLLGVFRKLVLSMSPRGRQIDTTTRARLSNTAARLHLEDGSVVASWLLLATVLALAVSWWTFSPLLAVVFSDVPAAPASQLELLAPLDQSQTPASHFDPYRMVFSAIAILSILAWYRLSKRLRRSGQSLPWTIATGAWVVTLLAVISLALPYRLTHEAKADAVTLNGAWCYQIGDRPSELLLFCPALEPRLQRARADAVQPVEPKVTESIFTRFAKWWPPDKKEGTPR